MAVVFWAAFFWMSAPLPVFSDGGASPTLDVCFNGRCFASEIAATAEDRARGLQERPSLGRDQGMLFVFEDSGQKGFWMKDTLIPLDIIWMDAQKRVVFIMPSVQPCAGHPCPVYAPDADAFYVLEVNAGAAGEIALNVGDQAEFDFPRGR